MQPAVINKVSFVASKGLLGSRLGVALTLASLGLSGCEYMGPSGAKKLQVPSALVIQEKKIKEEPAPANASPENPGATKIEVYPPSGALFGSPASAKEPAARQHPAKEGKYTLNFEDADLAEVAKVILGDTLKANYVISPKVTGKVSLQTMRPLADDELIPTLEMLLKTNGAALIKEQSLYRIEPEANATINAPAARLGLSGQDIPAGYQLRVVPLRYVGVAEMQKVLEPMMPPKSIVRADETRNLLLLAGTSDELDSAIETVRIFDIDFMRGMSVALFPLKNVDPTTIAEELDKLLTVSGKGPLGGMFRLMPIERLNAILAVTPQPRYLDEVQTWIERLDRYNTNKSGNMHVYRVQNVDAIELANTLSHIFGQSGRSKTPGASLSPGLSGASISGSGGGGISSGSIDGDGDRISSNTGGATTSSGLGGTSSSTSSSSSGLGSSSGGSSSIVGSGSGSSTGSSSLGSGSTRSSTGGIGASFGSSGGSSGATGQGRSRGASVADLGNNMKIVADPSNNALIIMAKAQDYREIEAVIRELDVMPLQVLIDATIVEVSLTDNLKYGLMWYFEHRGNDVSGAGVLGNPLPGKTSTTSSTSSTSSSSGSTTGTTTTSSSSINALGLLQQAATGGFTYSMVSMGNNIRMELDALAANNKVNVLSAPSLMVLNNQQATIKVGDQVPILTAQALPTSGTLNLVGTQSIQYRDTGVLLDVRPRVNAGGLVIMDVEQAVDNVKDQASTGGITSPTIAQRKIKSSVAVKNGETIVLGGLIKENVSNNLTGIPLLSRIPWFGSLFGQTSKNLDRTELVVLLTPRVVDSSRSSQQITNEFRRKLTGLYEQRQSPNAGGDIVVNPQ